MGTQRRRINCKTGMATGNVCQTAISHPTPRYVWRRGSTTRLSRTLHAALVAFALLGIAVPVHAATLALGEASALPGQSQVALPLAVTVAPGEQLSALVIEVQFDSSLATWQSVVLEPTAAALGKQVEANVMAPGHVRLVVYGLDRQSLTSGALIQCLVQVASSAPSGTSPVSLRDGLGADPDGNELSLSLSDGRLWVGAPPDTAAPQIRDVAVFNVTPTSATIEWLTDESARTTLSLGPTTGYGTDLVGEADFATAHQTAVTGLSAGTTYHFRVAATDAAGNRSETGDQTFATPNPVDTVPPSLTVDTPADGAAFDFGAPVSVAGNAVDDRLGNLTVTINSAPTTLGADGHFTSSLNGLASGSNRIVVEAVDGAGNRTQVQRSITVRAPPPTVQILSPLPGSTVTGTSVWVSFSVTNATLSDTGTHLALTLDGGPATYLSTLTPYSVGNLQPGAHTVTLQLVDVRQRPLLNPEATASVTFAVQSASTTGPSVTILSPPPYSTVGNPVYLQYAVKGIQIRKGTGYAHLHIRLDDGVVWHVFSTKPFLLGTLKPGTHTASVMLADNVTHLRIPGDQTYQKVTFTVKADPTVTIVAEPPSLQVLVPQPGSTMTGPTVYLQYSVTGIQIRKGTGYAHLHIRLDNGVVWHVYTTKPFVLSNLKPGTHTVSVMLADNVTHLRIPGTDTYQQVDFTVVAP